MSHRAELTTDPRITFANRFNEALRDSRDLTAVTTTATSYAFDAADDEANATWTDIVLADASGGAIQINLGAAADMRTGRVGTVMKTDSGVAAVTINAGASQINGSTSVSITMQYGAVRFFNTGSTYRILERYLT